MEAQNTNFMTFKILLTLDIPGLDGKPRSYDFTVEADSKEDAREKLDLYGDWFRVPDRPDLVEFRASHIAIIEISDTVEIKAPPTLKFSRSRIQ